MMSEGLLQIFNSSSSHVNNIQKDQFSIILVEISFILHLKLDKINDYA
jgi:hypothetical protein